MLASCTVSQVNQWTAVSTGIWLAYIANHSKAANPDDRAHIGNGAYLPSTAIFFLSLGEAPSLYCSFAHPSK